jgi:hypothetical protein
MPESSFSPLTSKDLSMADPPEMNDEEIEGAGREGVRSDSILCTGAKSRRIAGGTPDDRYGAAASSGA